MFWLILSNLYKNRFHFCVCLLYGDRSQVTLWRGKNKKVQHDTRDCSRFLLSINIDTLRCKTGTRRRRQMQTASKKLLHNLKCVPNTVYRIPFEMMKSMFYC